MEVIKICILGTKATGSTRLFNLVRLIYEKIGKKVFSGWNINSEHLEELSSKYNVILCKIHNTNFDYINDYNIKILPIRNLLDSAISKGVRKNNNSTEFYINICKENIILFNKFKSEADFIFRYEDYNVYYIKKFCSFLNMSLNNNDIIDIMKKLKYMHNSKDIVEYDNHSDKTYKKTLLSQNHNTSNGRTDKFIDLPETQLNDILEERIIYKFLEEQLYF